MILKLIHWFIRYSGVSYLFRRIFARNNISIVMYHNPEAEVFRLHMNYMSKRYNFITLSELIEVLYSPLPPRLPEYPLLITFDDGWKGNFKLLDMFMEFKLRPLIFLTSHLIDSNRNFWFTISTDAETESLKRKSYNQRLRYLKNKYEYSLEKEFPENRQVLNLEEIRKMMNYVDFGSHSSFHSILTICNPAEKSDEIEGSLARLEELLGMPLASFAYPNGDYDNETIELLKKCKMKVARTTDAGWNNRKSDPYRLKVTGVSDNASVTKLASELTGISMYVQYLLQGSLRGLKPGIKIYD